MFREDPERLAGAGAPRGPPAGAAGRLLDPLPPPPPPPPRLVSVPLFTLKDASKLSLLTFPPPSFAAQFQTEVVFRRSGLRRRRSQLIGSVARRSEPTPPCLGHAIGAAQPFQPGRRVVQSPHKAPEREHLARTSPRILVSSFSGVTADDTAADAPKTVCSFWANAKLS